MSQLLKTRVLTFLLKKPCDQKYIKGVLRGKSCPLARLHFDIK